MTAQSILGPARPRRDRDGAVPALVTTEALAPDYYAALASAFPTRPPSPARRSSPTTAPTACGRRRRSRHPRVAPVWREFVEYHCSDAYLRELVRFWGGAVAKGYPDFESLVGKPLPELSGAMRRYSRQSEFDPANLGADVVLDCQFVVNSPVRERSSVRGPHLDQPYTLFAALLYFRDPSDSSEGGDLELYRARGAGGRFDAHYRMRPRR